tara:strand:- start:746 stop:985 length:240 start_codon:yes stop_codon:yes gene_type:complete
MAFLRGQTNNPRFWGVLVILFLLVVIPDGLEVFFWIALIVVVVPWLIRRGKLRGIHDRLDVLEARAKDWLASSSSDSQD